MKRILTSPFILLAACFSSSDAKSSRRPSEKSEKNQLAKTVPERSIDEVRDTESESGASSIADEHEKLIHTSESAFSTPASLEQLPSPPLTSSPISRLLKRPPSLSVPIPSPLSRMSVEEQNALGILPGSPTIVLEPYDLVALNTPASAEPGRAVSAGASQRASVYSFDFGVPVVTTPVHEKQQHPFTVFSDNASKRASVISFASPIDGELIENHVHDLVEVSPTKGADPSHTTVVLSRTSILSDITNSGARMVNKRVSLQIPTDTIVCSSQGHLN